MLTRQRFTLTLALGMAACRPVPDPQTPTGDAFERITAAEAGYSEDGLAALRGFLETSGSESLLLLHDGKVLFAWGDIRQKRLVHSIRKPLLNALIGMEPRDGCLNLDRTLADLDVDDIAPALTEAEKQATLRHLLQSRSGVYHAAAAETEHMDAQRPARGSHAPGEHFYYNNWDFNVAGAVYERCTGTRIHEAFRRRLAEPLGMRDYGHDVIERRLGELELPTDVDGIRSLEPERSRHPAYHFRLSAHDLALFGQLYLDDGRWQDRRLLPSDWIDESTRPISILNADYDLAYGMLWNVLVPDPGDTRASFYHTGLGVHMLGIYPKHRLVLVHRVNTEQDFDFDDGKLYRMIRLVHAARLPAVADSS